MSVRGEAGDARTQDFEAIRRALLLAHRLENLLALAALDRLQADPGENPTSIGGDDGGLDSDSGRSGRGDNALGVAGQVLEPLAGEGAGQDQPLLRARPEQPLDVGGLQGRPCAGEQPATAPALERLRAIVDEQAEDEALWALNLDGTVPIAEAYLQQELRRLHAAAEAVAGAGTSAQPGQDLGAGTARPAQESQPATAPDIERLKRLAQAAAINSSTPWSLIFDRGPARHMDGTWAGNVAPILSTFRVVDAENRLLLRLQSDPEQVLRAEDAAYIAAVSPDVVLALIEAAAGAGTSAQPGQDSGAGTARPAQENPPATAPAEECPTCGGDAGNNWFDRSLCPEPCGGMHTRCCDCGAALDGCAYETPPLSVAVAGPSASAQAAPPPPEKLPRLEAVAEAARQVLRGLDRGIWPSELQSLSLALEDLGGNGVARSAGEPE